MTTKTRLKKLEAETGLDRPCHFCGMAQAQAKAVQEYLQQRGVNILPLRLAESKCEDCGRSRLCNVTGLDDETIAFYLAYYVEEYSAACEGREISGEMTAKEALFDQRYEDSMRGLYGEAYIGSELASIDALEKYVALYLPDRLAGLMEEAAIDRQALIAEATARSERK